MARTGNSPDSPLQDCISLLTDDHKKVLKMFDDFRAMAEDEDASDDDLQALVEQTCAELAVHTQIEEEYFYPAVREALDDPALIDEALVEHQSAEQLIGELQSMQPGDELYEARFNVLGEYVRHHIEEEQEKIFPQAKKSGARLADITQDMLARRDELREEFGLSEEGHPDIPPPDRPAKRDGHAQA